MVVIKRVSLVRRKEGLPVEEFQRYWREVHGPLAIRVPGLRRYIPTHVLPETYNSANPPLYDGLPEAWYDSLEAYRNRTLNASVPRDPQWSDFCRGQEQLLSREVVLID